MGRAGPARTIYRVVSTAIGHMATDDGWAMASHLALSALMAIFPFLICIGAFAGFIGQASLAESVSDLIFAAWPVEIAEPISLQVHDVLTVRRGGVLTVSILATLYLASNGVEAVRIGLNRAYGRRETRSIFFLRLQSILFVILGGLLSLAIAVFGLLGPAFWRLAERALPEVVPFRASFFSIRYPLLALLLTAGLVAAHRFLPKRMPARIWPGIVATLLLWWVATAVFSQYIEDFANYTATYAGLASVVAALFYLYVMGLILLFGAEFNAALARVRGEAVTAEEVTPTAITGSAREKRRRGGEDQAPGQPSA
jgi:membrane protein